LKAVILAGGLGTRLSEETYIKPKPMVEIGGKPIIWHIMKYYSYFGINEFVICCGYKGYLIKEYFLNYFHHMSDVTIDLKKNYIDIHHKKVEPWKITMVDTGDKTMTGGRIKRIQNCIQDETFCLTYGDGLSDINIKTLVDFHKKTKRLATISGTEPPGRFGALTVDGDKVIGFQEKPLSDKSIINGGFFVLEPGIFDFIEGDHILWEKEPLENLASQGQLSVFRHHGFWQPMDTLREKNILEELWGSNKAPWKLWD
jgi:glucose-1-phosphate cytidylyltransferase